MNKFLEAFLKAQKKIESVKKEGHNPYFNSNYATLNNVLDTCKIHLNDEGISILQPMGIIDGKMVVKTILYHESGEYIESFIQIPPLLDMQKIGSAITYARRYTLQALICIGAEDDDANQASGIKDIPSYDNIKTNYKPEIVTQVLEKVQGVFPEDQCPKCGQVLKRSKAGNLYCPGKYDGSCK